MEKVIKINEGVIKIITENDKVTVYKKNGGITSSDLLNVLAQILIPIANSLYKGTREGVYIRKNPYKFTECNEPHHSYLSAYIEYAEPNDLQGYIIKKEKLFRLSHRDNIMDLKDKFIFDIMDYLAFKGYVDRVAYAYELIKDRVEYEEVEYVTKINLRELGFMNVI